MFILECSTFIVKCPIIITWWFLELSFAIKLQQFRPGKFHGCLTIQLTVSLLQATGRTSLPAPAVSATGRLVFSFRSHVGGRGSGGLSATGTGRFPG